MYTEFKNKYPEHKVGFTKFVSHRPQECVLIGSSGTHTVCVCVIHQNIKLMLASAFKSDDENNFCDYHTWLNLGICQQTTEKCYFGNCMNCPGFDNIKGVLQEYYDKNNIEFIKFNLWTQTDRSFLETRFESVDDFIDNFVSRLPKLLKHSFLSKQQSSYFNKVKENLGEQEILVVLDFAENYSFKIQDEVQSYHWSNDQATIHPFGIYYMENNELKFTNFVIISDITKHNTFTVDIFIREFINFISRTIQTPKKNILFFRWISCTI